LYAGFWKRLFAHILDVIVLYFLFILLGFLTVVFEMLTQHLLLFSHTRSAVLWYQGFFIIKLIFFLSIGWLYYAILESSKLQGTFGKKALGIIVVDEQFRRISFGRAVGRFCSKIVSLLTLGIGFIMAAFTKNKRALHDIIATTYVVDKRVLEMYSAQYQQYPPYLGYPQYPQHQQYPQYPQHQQD
jgi:uncharacterized RDD family membrane protein YckC